MMPAKTTQEPREAAQEPVERPRRHCPNCGRWTVVDDRGRIGIHDYAAGECPGSLEDTDLTRAMSEVIPAPNDVPAGVLAAARCIVRALLSGNGRLNICDSEDELRHRLAQDGVEISGENFSAALELLEENGRHRRAVPGLPYKVVRLESRLHRSRLNPNPPKGIVLEVSGLIDLPACSSLLSGQAGRARTPVHLAGGSCVYQVLARVLDLSARVQGLWIAHLPAFAGLVGSRTRCRWPSTVDQSC
jgi:hypothetical protein